MSNPSRFWRVVWVEMFRESEQDRNFRSEARAARQVAAILACPDDVATLRGVWVTSGFKDDQIVWTPLDPEQLVAAHADDHDTNRSDLDDESISIAEWRARIADAWKLHTQGPIDTHDPAQPERITT